MQDKLDPNALIFKIVLAVVGLIIVTVSIVMAVRAWKNKLPRKG